LQSIFTIKKCHLQLLFKIKIKKDFFFLHTQSGEVNKDHKKKKKTPVLWPNIPKLLVKDTNLFEGGMKYEIVDKVL
jgi:hypothetical protein